LPPALVVDGLVPATPIILALCLTLGVAGKRPATNAGSSFNATEIHSVYRHGACAKEAPWSSHVRMTISVIAT